MRPPYFISPEPVAETSTRTYPASFSRTSASTSPGSGKVAETARTTYPFPRPTSTRAPGDVPVTLPSYIISARAAGWRKVPSVVARVRK